MSNQPSTEVTISGRVVNGHPMTRRPVTRKDPVTKVEIPVMDRVTGLQVTDCYFAVAVPKAGETDWKQTAWGQQIHNRAKQDWPNGEHGHPNFSWKIIDGDSLVPNKKNKIPAEREGWPGHWVIHCSTRFSVKCYHVGKYDPMTDQIQEENQIKCGDYCRAVLGIKGNNPSETAGIYIDPLLFELSRAGTPIINDTGPSAADKFGGGAPATPAATMMPGQGPAVPVVPATDLLQPAAPVEVKYLDANGNAFTEAVLLAAGFQPAQIAAMPRA